jgi:D-alanyl-D-alanine carboxypeptidase
LALAVLAAVVAAASDADARGRRKRHVVRQGGGYSPPYAAIVVDVNSGKVLHATNPDAIRHPASLTKIMTLYLLFEQLEAGKVRLDTPLPVSAHAASQAPSKLGLRPGQSISVEDAIKALVTKSANDVAVIIAEAIAGDEEDFAKMMTRKARAIGMARTVYANASGLPDDDQVTTARDQATLGRAIQDRFPRYYRYFSTASFQFHGRSIRNHNNLLGRVEGVDGIKTGFIRKSGFNLVSSMKRDGRHLVATVLGGSSGRWRDARMRDLLEGNVALAAVKRTTPRAVEIADAAEPARELAIASREPATEPVSTRGVTLAHADPRIPARIPPAEAVAAPAAPMQSYSSFTLPKQETAAPGSADPIKPIMVRTVSVTRPAPKTSLVASLPQGSAEASRAAAAQPGRAAQPSPGAIAPRQVASVGEPIAVPALSESKPPRVAPGEWLIQVGAFPAETQAKDRLKEARDAAPTALSRAEPFTEAVVKGDGKLYRARFAGFPKEQAEAICKQLKRSDISCLALRN